MIDLNALPTSSLLPENEAAKVLGVKPETLTCWRCTRRVDIPYVKIGRCVRYRVGDLRTFIEANLQGTRCREVA